MNEKLPPQESANLSSPQAQAPKLKILEFFLKNVAQNKPTFLGHLMITGISISLITISFFVLKHYADKKSQDWTNNYLGSISRDEVLACDVQNFKDVKATQLEKRRLQAQCLEIQQRIRIHKDVMLFFYQQYFLSISMTSGLAIIAGICIFFIAQFGWKNSNPALINIFIVTTSAGLLYQKLPEVFKQDINLQANGVLYIKYIDLNNELMSYLATQLAKNIKSDTPNQLIELEPKKFIYYIDSELAKFNQIPIEFDATKVIKLNDLQDALNIQSIDKQPKSVPSRTEP